MKDTRITLTNNFHNTETTITAKGGNITASQLKRAERKLCGMTECMCGKVDQKAEGLDGKNYRLIHNFSDDGECAVLDDYQY